MSQNDGAKRGASLWTARGLTPLFPSPRVRRAKSPLACKAKQRISSARRIARFRPSLLRKAKAESSLRSPKPRGTHAPLGFGRLPAFGLPLNHARDTGVESHRLAKATGRLSACDGHQGCGARWILEAFASFAVTSFPPEETGLCAIPAACSPVCGPDIELPSCRDSHTFSPFPKTDQAS